MSEISIAVNRLGLGARPDEPLPGDGKRWALAQFERYDPRPAPVAAAPTRTAVAGELAQYVQTQKMLRQQGFGRRIEKSSAVVPAPTADGQAMAPGVAPPATPPAPVEPYDPVREARKFVGQQIRTNYMDSVGARAQAALLTPTPFMERLVHFWSNHFAVSADKVQVTGMSGLLEFEAIRPHVLGKFSDMLVAVETHPAMLLYLDQAQSVGPNSQLSSLLARRSNGPRKVPGLNENLAREIMELHTLGVRTGYTQADVTEFARALTGWSVWGIERGPIDRLVSHDAKVGDFIFAAPLHEPGARTIMGKRYAEPGIKQAGQVLADLSVHPATAEHISTKLARHFAGDTPPPALVARLQATYLRTGGDLPSLYRVLIAAPEVWADQPVKFKTPWEWTLSAYRGVGAREIKAQTVTGLLSQLGQPAWRPGAPAGYDDVAASWAAPDAIMRRVEAAERFGQRAGNAVDARQIAPKLFPAALTPATTQALANADSPGQALALLLVAPEFMRR